MIHIFNSIKNDHMKDDGLFSGCWVSSGVQVLGFEDRQMFDDTVWSQRRRHLPGPPWR